MRIRCAYPKLPPLSFALRILAIPFIYMLTKLLQLLDHLESLPLHSTGGYILDWHACDLFPERWIDLVIVLRCDSTLLYDRLTARGYKGKKLEENMDSEIMQVLLDEARESYKEEIVVELKSESTEDVEGNLERVEQWVQQWRKDHAEDGQ
jgi:adenylate kinase